MFHLGTGNKFFGINENDFIIYEVNIGNGMLFGEPIIIEDSIYSLGVFNPTKFESRLCLFEFSLSEEKLLNQIDLGAGGIISCDTSGLTSHGDNLVIGTHSGKIKYCDHHKKILFGKFKEREFYLVPNLGSKKTKHI